MAERPDSGVLDTCAYIDLAVLEANVLPKRPQLTSITLAELQQGVVMASDPAVRAGRAEILGAAMAEFDPLPFDTEAAVRYGTLVALTLRRRRNPKPRRLDLMIAAIASARELPLYTRNPADFAGLQSAVRIVPV